MALMLGLSFSDIKLTVGYAGRWFNQHISGYPYPGDFPGKHFNLL